MVLVHEDYRQRILIARQDTVGSPLFERLRWINAQQPWVSLLLI